MPNENVRQEVLAAFGKDYYFYHRKPYEYEDFIDGMAWVGLLCGAALIAKDTEVVKQCEGYLRNILRVGEDARNYVPVKLNNKYVLSLTGYYYREGQEFAGPAGLHFAVSNGADIDNPYEDKIIGMARARTRWGYPFGWWCKWGKYPRQHINSMFIAYLIQGKRPSSSMKWMTKYNPFFSYIYGKKMTPTAWPEMRRTSRGYNETRKEVVPLHLGKPSSWLFRKDPFSEYVREGEKDQYSYTPIARLTAEYLQEDL